MYKSFIGKKTTQLLIFSIFAGIFLSAIEVSFSILIQAFLLSLGVLNTDNVQLPHWLPTTFLANLLLFGTVAIIRGFSQWIKLYTHAMTSASFTHHIRGLIADWALTSSESRSGQVFTLLNDRVNNGSDMMIGVQNSAIHFFSISLILVYLLKTSLLMTLSGLGILIFFSFLLKGFDQKVKKSGQMIVQQSVRINDRLSDAVKNLQFLKISRAELYELNHLHQSLNESFKHLKVFTSIKCSKFAAPQFIGAFVILLIAIYNKKYQALAGGTLVSFIYLFVRCSQMLADSSVAMTTLKLNRSGFNDLFDWWLKNRTAIEKIQLRKMSEKNTSLIKNLKPTSWKLQDIDFNFEKNVILNKFNLITQPGEITVITGASGKGKSTLLHLMTGLLLPSSGVLLVNNRFTTVESALNSNEISFGFVGPDPHVINGTVLENLTYGNLTQPTSTEIKEALSLSHCLEFLPQLPQALERKLSDRGDGLSAGQKQRLALARALLRKPSALILDEPTANLDEESSQYVIESLKKLKGQTSIIIVTHQNSLKKIADQTVEF